MSQSDRDWDVCELRIGRGRSGRNLEAEHFNMCEIPGCEDYVVPGRRKLCGANKDFEVSGA